jgi:CheY-like chemotaxis protein
MGDEKEKILVVDDEASHRTMLKAVLSSEGYQIFEADDGKTAIEAVEREFYDLILIDVRMTELDTPSNRVPMITSQSLWI